MGITIDVESIIIPASRRTPGPFERLEAEKRQVARICQAFSWSKVSWDEPSEHRGRVSTSFSQSRYLAFLQVATAVIETNQHLIQPEGEPPKSPQAILPHLLKRAPWTNYYIPVSFEEPIYFEDTDYGVLVSVGSSWALSQELIQLQQAMDQYSAINGEANLASLSNSRYRWEAIAEVGEVLLSGAKESSELNLPMKLYG